MMINQQNGRIVAEKNLQNLIDDLLKYATEGDLYSLKEILTLGANVNDSDANGELALHCAVRNNHIEVVEQLLSVGANPNSIDLSGQDALYYAAINNNITTAKLLIDAGALVNGSIGITVPPIIAASVYNKLDMVSALIDFGANVDIVDKKGKTAYFYAQAQNHDAVKKILLEAGATPIKVKNAKKKSKWKLVFRRR